MVYELVPASSGDKAWLERLRRDVYRELFTTTFGGWDEVRHLRQFNACWERGHISIIRVNGEPVGMIQLLEDADAVQVSEIQIQTTHQSRGIGGRILKETIARAGAQGRQVKLAVGLQNHRALQLYQRLGFRKVASDETHHHMVFESKI